MSEQITEDATSEETETQDQNVQDTSEGETSLGDAGKKALDAMKAQRKAAQDEARQAKQELDQLRRELEMRDKPAEEQALEAAKAEARAEATSTANKRILRSELKALATGKLADPTDAALYINLDDFSVDDNGDVDSDALTEAISDLIARKPHLGAAKQNRFDGSADQGAAGKDTGRVKQFTREELSNLGPDQIVVAKAAGQLDDLLGIKH